MYGVIGNEKREWNPDCILHLWKKNGLFGNEWMEWSVKHLLRSFVRNKKHIHTNKRLTQEFCNLIHRKFDCRTILEIKRTSRLTQICLFSSIKMGLQNPFNICCRFISSVHRGYQISKRPRWKIGLSKVEVTLPEIYTIGICYIHESLSLIQCHHECASIRIATILCVRTYYTSKNYTIESYRVLLLPIFFHVKVIVKRSSQKTILWSSLLLVVSYNFLMQMNIINFLETNLSCF